MAGELHLREGRVLTGPNFSEPMLVETVRENGSGVWMVGMVGQHSERFRRVTLTEEDISKADWMGVKAMTGPMPSADRDDPDGGSTA